MRRIMVNETGGERVRLTRERVLEAAIHLADTDGVEALSMRRLAQALGVVPMALYKHVSNKEDLLDAMIDLVVATIDHAPAETGWRLAVRGRILAARAALLRHRWAPSVIESRVSAPPAVLDHMNALMAAMRAGGLSVDLTHHAMHAIGSRMWGFTQEVFPTPAPPEDPAQREAFLSEAAHRYPAIVELATDASHDPHSAIGCDDQFEFEFALDLLLDGIERLHNAAWSSKNHTVSA